jgi:pimeloyl-ACP methyl ester carboxylesterase
LKVRALLAAFLAVIATAAGQRLLRRAVRVREDVDWELAEKPGRVAYVDGVGIHYVERGSGPAVVMLHGFGGHTFSFRHTILDLSRDHRVIAVDLMGFGYSERFVEGDYSQTRRAWLVMRLMDRLGIQKATLLGHSMGGGTAMRIAATWPERVDSLVLAASTAGERFRSRAFGAARLLKPLLPLLPRIASSRLLLVSVHDSSFLTAELRDAYLAPARIKGSMEGLARMMEDTRHDEPVAYERVTQPALILWASKERVLPPRMLDELRRCVPHARVEIVEEAGHLLLEERPEVCNALIREFLRGFRAASVQDQEIASREAAGDDPAHAD